MALFEATYPSQKKVMDLIRERYENRVPFIRVASGCFDNDSIMILVSFDKKEDWAHGYVENSNYFRMAIYDNGQMEVFTQSMYTKEHRNDPNYRLSGLGVKFRKTNVKTIDKMFEKFDAFISKIEEAYK